MPSSLGFVLFLGYALATVGATRAQLAAPRTQFLNWSLMDNAACAHVGFNDGQNETWAFTEVDRTVSAGLSLKGAAWSRQADWQPAAWFALAFDYQWTQHPGYNRDRGPVSIFGIRAHLAH